MSPPPSAQFNADTDDELRSTWPQRAWTLAAVAAILRSLSTSVSLAAASGTAADLLAVCVAAVAAYSLADLTSGVYHWAIDNYGDASTPVLGSQIAAFQSHHRHPSSIARREVCNNLHVAARAVAVALPAAEAALTYGVGASAAAAAHAFLGVFAACVVLSQQFHAWAHEKTTTRRLPPGVAALQAAGLLLSRPEHAAHHRPPYNTNYCIINGMWNGVLGRFQVFEALEKVIYLRTGVKPRSWDKPDAKMIL
ncbi:hypothetical protein ACP70R_012036 [Stipagrostis hirtigluma subsp. patula]